MQQHGLVLMRPGQIYIMLVCPRDQPWVSSIPNPCNVSHAVQFIPFAEETTIFIFFNLTNLFDILNRQLAICILIRARQMLYGHTFHYLQYFQIYNAVIKSHFMYHHLREHR